MKKVFGFIFLSIIVCSIMFLPVSNFAFAYDTNDNVVYLGGTPIGVLANSEGIIATDYVDVVTEKGVICPSKNAGLLLGDMIVGINDTKIVTIDDIKTVVSKEFVPNKPLSLQIIRDNQKLQLDIMPSLDAALKEYKLGIIGKSHIAGVGTLTYIRKDLRFGGLGHKIYDVALPLNEYYKSGTVYKCTILGVVKGEENKAGELRGHFDREGVAIGNINKNNNYGIFGSLEKDAIANRSLIAVGSKNDVKMGKAFIFTTIDGIKPEMYSIEIIKNTDQKSAEQKGMVLRITDSRLLEKTAGIVQGMSGSPIIQNDKLIGAVTHVFVNDPTKGYGVYIDWMINN